MAFLEELLEGGSTYRVKTTKGGAVVQPISDSDDDLDAFQDIVVQIEDNEGEGYEVSLTHPVSTRGRNLIDRIVIAID
ncbi:hypothetical protein GCM10008023_40200 [Sphingomonas glacialis]|uniref:Uncharacterized protein n=1 Tax=Sphingomonas glacialis TaxID=658225 RepID=A0ABQ3LV91_9SPHN|nr:hypothetical protein [Sphingomonas glacialis]GHH26099.1 hypothetical protein GCM10008023_40200 [Sphingomonas glacialis]